MTSFITDRCGSRYEIVNEKLTCDNADELLELYRMHIGMPGCTWNEYYPALEDVLADIAESGLYCVRDADGAAAAAVSVTHDAQIAALDCRSLFHPDTRVVSRLAVRPELLRRGIARALLEYAEAAVRRKGCGGLFLLVAPGNAAALELYASAGFRRCGRRELFGMQWECCEKSLLRTRSAP